MKEWLNTMIATVHQNICVRVFFLYSESIVIFHFNTIYRIQIDRDKLLKWSSSTIYLAGFSLSFSHSMGTLPFLTQFPLHRMKI